MKKIDNIDCICNYCKANKTKAIYKHLNFSVVKCIKCGLCYLFPQPNKVQINKYYTQNYFSSTTSVGYTDYKGLKLDLEKEGEKKIEIIKKFVKNGKLLDAGCGYGNFLKIAKKNNFEVSGCDIVLSVIKKIKKDYSIPVFLCDLSKASFKNKYNIVTAWDVIEHMSDPMYTLIKFNRSLQNNGWLFMTTPDIESIDAKILGKYWYGFKRIPEHLYYFSPDSITKLLEKAGFINIQIMNWGFQRNLNYCIDQIGKYNKTISNFIKLIFKNTNFLKKTMFFPFIDMIVIAQKKDYAKNKLL